MEDGHFWYAGRWDLLDGWLKALRPRPDQIVLDAGSGTGQVLERLTARGFQAVGLDFLPEAVRLVRKRGKGLQMIRGVVEHLPFRDDSVFVILLLDVLEHTDDERALQEARRVLVPGGWLVTSVPAMPWLWSSRDVQAGHRRRYTRRLLVDRLTQAGLEVVATQYYQFMLFPVVVLSRVAARHKPKIQEWEEQPCRLVNGLLKAVVGIEVVLGRWLKWPWGSSILALARKANAGRI
jgi:SAM-dependent methyltransferase|nr:ubiquinone/menaquinone biosynthesis C-methyltransferase UbiE [uncultured bacterium]